jgi:quercetin dioxygenase-like cupin family protein
MQDGRGGEERLTTPKLRPRNKQSPHWDALPGGKTFGTLRAACSGLAGTNFTVNKVLVLVGQHSPPHDWSGEHVVYQLVGQMEFEIGDQTYHLDPQDMLFIPARVVYRYRNVADDNAAFLSIIGRVDEWPSTGQYFSDE